MNPLQYLSELHEEAQEPEVHSSIDDLQEFVNSQVWLDLSGLLSWQLDQIHVAMEDAATFDAFRVLQGAAGKTRDFLGLPELLIREKQMDAMAIAEINRELTDRPLSDEEEDELDDQYPYM